MNNLAPIVLFVYNRLEHTKHTIESLQKTELADKSELLVFCDGAKNDSEIDKVSSVKKYIKSVTGFKYINIIERENNIGLANSVISGVSEVFNNYNKAIIIEDDLLFSKNFLVFMNSSLNQFINIENVFSISGYNFPIEIPNDYKHDIYMAPRASSWGWGTWKDRWEKTDWNVSDFNDFVENNNSVNEFNKGGVDLTRMLKNQVSSKIDSWAIRWTYSHFKNKAYCIYPVKSKVQNIGTDSTGLHSITTNKFDVALDSSVNNVNIDTNIFPDERILKNFRMFFKFTLWERIYWRLKRNFKVKN